MPDSSTSKRGGDKRRPATKSAHTRRVRTAARLSAEGMSTAAIAEKVGRSERAVQLWADSATWIDAFTAAKEGKPLPDDTDPAHGTGLAALRRALDKADAEGDYKAIPAIATALNKLDTVDADLSSRVRGASLDELRAALAAASPGQLDALGEVLAQHRARTEPDLQDDAVAQAFLVTGIRLNPPDAAEWHRHSEAQLADLHGLADALRRQRAHLEIAEASGTEPSVDIVSEYLAQNNAETCAPELEGSPNIGQSYSSEESPAHA